jgi:hypothetical protein
MKRLRELNRWRDRAWERNMGGEGDDLGGCFRMPSESWPNVELRCIAASGEGWDHISVTTSLPRCPTWAEMEQVKRAFFRPDEAAMQLHLPPSAHISVHPHCLHIWRPHAQPIPLPPAWMVG